MLMEYTKGKVNQYTMYNDEPSVIEFGSMEQKNSNTKSRQDNEAYVSYQIGLDATMKVTKAALVGERLFDIVPVIIARTGGLSNFLSGLSLLLVGIFTKSSFIAHVLQNVFLVRKYQENIPADHHSKRSFAFKKEYKDLKKNLDSNQLNSMDVNYLVHEIADKREQMKDIKQGCCASYTIWNLLEQCDKSNKFKDR